MSNVTEILTLKDVTLFELKHPSIIQSLTGSTSLGFSFLPPIVANRLNIYAEKGNALFQNRNIRFVFLTTPVCCDHEKHLTAILETITWELTDPLKPLVWVIAQRIIISKILGNMEIGQVAFYHHVAPHGDVRLYELHKEENNYKATLFHQKHLFENLN